MGVEIPKWIDEGAGAATCNLLTIGSQVAAGYAVKSAITAQLWPTLGLAGASAAMAGVASLMNCNHNAGQPPGSQATCDRVGGWNASGVKVWMAATSADAIATPNCTKARSASWPETELGSLRFQGAVKDVIVENLPANSCGFVSQKRVRILKAAGGEITNTLMPTNPVEGYWQFASMQAIIRPFDGGAVTNAIPDCHEPGDVPLSVYDYKYTDASTGCSYTYKLQDSWIDSAGHPRFAWAVDGDSTARAGCQGGRITGYIWAPRQEDRIYFNPGLHLPGGGGGGGGGLPWKFSPDWGSIMDTILRVMSFNDPGDLYRLVSVCETDAEGEPVSRAVEVDIPPGIRDAGASTRVRLKAIVELLQGLKDFKQPICPPERPKQQGDWVTVNFLSDEPSPGGSKRLRKYMRYRDQANRAHIDHVHHWEDFAWEAGPVCVISKGLSWGWPKVWAATAEEGKRVIGHAAAIAGLDLSDPKHEWVVTGSSDPRFGMSGTMRVERRNDGWIRVSKRDGPNGLPKLYGPSLAS